MKKRNKIILLVLGTQIVFLAIIALVAYNLFAFPKNTVEVSGNVIENTNINYDVFCRIDDRLYYTYEKNEFNYGVAEITSSGSKRIDWEGPSFPYYSSTRFFSFNGHLYLNAYDRTVNERHEKKYIPESGAFVSDELSEFFDAMDINHGLEDIFYMFNENEALYLGDEGIFHYKNGKSELLISNNNNEKSIDTPTVNNNDIYYVTYEEPYHLILCYSLEEKTTEIVYKDYNNIRDLEVVDNKIYFEGLTDNKANGFFVFDMSETSKTAECLYLGEAENYDVYYIKNFEIFEEYAYIATESGLAKVNIHTGEDAVLYDRGVEGCYIVDDKWVYFAHEKKSTLWRVPQAGGEVEKVFG